VNLKNKSAFTELSVFQACCNTQLGSEMRIVAEKFDTVCFRVFYECFCVYAWRLEGIRCSQLSDINNGTDHCVIIFKVPIERNISRALLYRDAYI
jgi:hypothetical protein